MVQTRATRVSLLRRNVIWVLSKSQRVSLLTSHACAMQGQASDIVIHAEEIVKLRGRINQLYQLHTGQQLDTIGVPSANLHVQIPMLEGLAFAAMRRPAQ